MHVTWGCFQKRSANDKNHVIQHDNFKKAFAKLVTRRVETILASWY